MNNKFKNKYNYYFIFGTNNTILYNTLFVEMYPLKKHKNIFSNKFKQDLYKL